jgi:hypothetical protein
MYYHVKTDVYINKSPDVVWKALVDFPSYSQWNPFITSIEQVSDTKLVAVMKSGKSSRTFRPDILEMKPNRELRWRGKLGGVSGIFTGEHYFILSPEKEGTFFQQGEMFSGVLAWILLPFMKNEIHGNFTKFNLALKALVERN